MVLLPIINKSIFMGSYINLMIKKSQNINKIQICREIKIAINKGKRQRKYDYL